MAEPARHAPEIDGRGVLVAAALIAVAVIAAVVVAWSLVAAFGGAVRATHAPPADLQPQLQPQPREDLATYRAREQAKISGYDWIDRNAGIVRVPVARAMDLLIARAGSGARKDGTTANPDPQDAKPSTDTMRGGKASSP
jgi:hypothetical protein